MVETLTKKLTDRTLELRASQRTITNQAAELEEKSKEIVALKAELEAQRVNLEEMRRGDEEMLDTCDMEDVDFDGCGSDEMNRINDRVQ